MRNAPFVDRFDAGRKLAALLGSYRDVAPVVLALPRGGVPVAFEVAASLAVPVDLVLVRKIGAPGDAELGIGAVVDGAEPQVVVDDALLRRVRPPEGYVEAETQRQLREIERRRLAYLGDRPPPMVAGRTVIVVDDGIATGNTARAALRALRRAGASRLILAVPVVAEDTRESLLAEADEIVSVETPRLLRSVGEYYRDFTQTSDAEVVALLRQATAA